MELKTLFNIKPQQWQCKIFSNNQTIISQTYAMDMNCEYVIQLIYLY